MAMINLEDKVIITEKNFDNLEGIVKGIVPAQSGEIMPRYLVEVAFRYGKQIKHHTF